MCRVGVYIVAYLLLACCAMQHPDLVEMCQVGICIVAYLILACCAVQHPDLIEKRQALLADKISAFLGPDLRSSHHAEQAAENGNDRHTD